MFLGTCYRDLAGRLELLDKAHDHPGGGRGGHKQLWGNNANLVEFLESRGSPPFSVYALLCFLYRKWTDEEVTSV